MVDERHVTDRRPTRVASLLGTTLGAVSLVGGLTWMLLNLHGPAPAVDLAVGVVFTLGGLVLLMPHRVRLPKRPALIVALAAGAAGTAAGMIAHRATECCTYAYVVDRGFPFHWLRRGGVADDPEVARRLAATDGWHADVASLSMNLVVWAYAGVLVFALVIGLRRLAARR